MGKLLHILLDDPRDSWKFLHSFVRKRINRFHSNNILSVGCCSLRIVHKTSFSQVAYSTEGMLVDVFRALGYLFCYSPSSREDYTTIAESTTYPLHLCTTR